MNENNKTYPVNLFGFMRQIVAGLADRHFESTHNTLKGFAESADSKAEEGFDET